MTISEYAVFETCSKELFSRNLELGSKVRVGDTALDTIFGYHDYKYHHINDIYSHETG